MKIGKEYGSVGDPIYLGEIPWSKTAEEGVIVVAEGREDGIGNGGVECFEEVSEDFEGVFFIPGCGHVVAGQEYDVGLEAGAFVDETAEKGAESTNMEVREVEDGLSVQGVG